MEITKVIYIKKYGIVRARFYVVYPQHKYHISFN
jgi:hypothetical protein